MRVRMAVLLVLAMLAACTREPGPDPAAAPAAKPEPVQPAQPAQPAGGADAVQQPALRVTTLDGNTFDLAGELGKWVIVNF